VGKNAHRQKCPHLYESTEIKATRILFAQRDGLETLAKLIPKSITNRKNIFFYKDVISFCIVYSTQEKKCE
jgi:hypothetical protein